MTELAFVDTNVLLYAFDTGEPAKRRRADRVLRELGSQRAVISPQVLSEFYVNVQRLAEPLAQPEARLAVERLARLRTVPLDSDRVLEALAIQDRWQTSYWDALIFAAAAAAGCAEVFSEDLQHGQTIAGVQIVNPFVGL